MAAKKIIPIPFDPLTGDQQHYAESKLRRTGETHPPDDRGYERPVYERVEPVWKDNYVFEAELELTEMSRGRSAAYFHWEDVETGQKYTMFMVDLLDVVQNTIVEKGRVRGSWTFGKRGQNYGIKRHG